MDELLSEFLAITNEDLSKVDQDLVELESKPSDREVLNRIFRAVHSVKGTCGMFGLSRLERVAHAGEDVLGRMREGALPVTPDSISPVLAAIDAIKEIVAGLLASGAEPPGNDDALIEKLHALAQAQAGAPAPAPAQGAAAAEPTEKKESKAPPAEQQSLRVNVELLDSLMNLVGELVLSRNQLTELARADDESVYLAPIQQLNRITSDLQEKVMKTRMQPVGNAWSKLPRVVRDVAHATGKQIELEMTGQETEIDRQVLQAIQDPLVHCVRNSGDHGIETPEARTKSGKAPAGKIAIDAYHEGGHIIIEIADDGAGIDVERVRAKAVERGLVAADAAAELGEAQVLRFIFEPGFSTAAKVTEVSGRGVGMDVVRSNIEKIGGSVDLSTERGKGTVVRIKIPLTLAIISALIVSATGGDDLFAVPQVGIVELVRIAETTRHLIEDIHGSKVLRLRDRLLPLVDLAGVLRLPVDEKRVEFSVVVAQVGDQHYGLVVREIFDTQEIVVKPVGRLLRDANLFSGTTILGDGRVILILDSVRLAARALPLSATESQEKTVEEPHDAFQRGELTSLLVFKSGRGAPMAVPLALVARLEEFPLERVETIEERWFVQYRGGLLPLIPCQPGMALGGQENGRVPAVIFSDGRRSMGLVVGGITDVVEERLAIESAGRHDGTLGAAIVSGHATEIIDTYYFLQLAFPDWFEGKGRAQGRAKRRILVVEDSPFFRDMLRPLLESKGYEILLAADGSEALDCLAREQGRFDLVLSDIEMPVLDGIGLAVKVRENPAWRALPMVALTSLDSAADRARAFEAGFTDYLMKFNQDTLLTAVEAFLRKGDERRAV